MRTIKVVNHLLKSFLVNTAGWTSIKSLDVTENGHGALLAWLDHYNGQGELLKHMAFAKMKIKNCSIGMRELYPLKG